MNGAKAACAWRNAGRCLRQCFAVGHIAHKKEARHANVFHLFLFLCEKQQGLFGCGFVVSLFNNTSFLARERAEIIQFRTTNFTTLVHFN